ncbi:MAG: hypothetical protein DMH00_00365 [Acidobacteria bacterium]|nr:MAG: hypothetical protein DMH00_00365 [Acidobacteriota bacterium]
MPFAEPRALLLLLLIPFLGILLTLVRIRRRRLLQRFGQEELVTRLVEAPGGGRWLVRVALLLLGTAFLSLALARPQWGPKVEEVRRQGVDVVIAMDVSNSMLAEDVKPSRLARAREEVASLIDSLEGDRVGLVAFAGEAYVACPLTLDYAAAKDFLDVLDPGLVPVPGTALATAPRVDHRRGRPRARRAGGGEGGRDAGSRDLYSWGRNRGRLSDSHSVGGRRPCLQAGPSGTNCHFTS